TRRQLETGKCVEVVGESGEDGPPRGGVGGGGNGEAERDRGWLRRDGWVGVAGEGHASSGIVGQGKVEEDAEMDCDVDGPDQDVRTVGWGRGVWRVEGVPSVAVALDHDPHGGDDHESTPRPVVASEDHDPTASPSRVADPVDHDPAPDVPVAVVAVSDSHDPASPPVTLQLPDVQDPVLPDIEQLPVQEPTDVEDPTMHPGIPNAYSLWGRGETAPRMEPGRGMKRSRARVEGSSSSEGRVLVGG
ncbi:hypothetical protein HDU93_002553, partial [Gonapodya sp. JEL0774]